MNLKPENITVPGEILSEFRDITNVLVEIFPVPTALIIKLSPSYLEVLCSGESGKNPYRTGERIPDEDPFWKEIISQKKEVLIADAKKEEQWQKSFPVGRGMVSYLGNVLLSPNNEIFGVLCIMDSRENHFQTPLRKLLYRFKREIETLLRLLYSAAESKKDKIDLMGAEEKLESVGILAGGIAQDFNGLLSVIIGNISLARMDVPPGEKVYDLLLESEKASCQAADIAQKLITFSEGGWLVRREERLSTILKELTDSGSLKSRVTFNVDLPLPLPAIFVDEGQFKQVLLNIFLNAADAMPEGGEVKINAENITIGEDGISALQPGQYIKLSIADRGPGIPQEYLNKIFDPYFSTKNSLSQRGMGLGLSICYSIIKKHDGWIAVESEEGKGTTVHLYIPVFNEEYEKERLNI